MPIRLARGRVLGLRHAKDGSLQSYPAVLWWERVASDIVRRVRNEIRELKQEIAEIEALCEGREHPRKPKRQ